MLRKVVGAAGCVKLRAAFVLILAAGLFACADAPDNAAASAAQQLSIGGESGTELANLQILHVGNGADPQTVDPHRGEGVPGSNVLRDLFEGLTQEAPDGRIIPGVATSWEVSEDGKTYTFQLRKTARWSNGEAVTAADFEYGLQRSVDPATLSNYSSVLEPIVNARAIIRGELPASALGVEAVDDQTFVIRLTAPTPYFPGLLTHSTTYPVNRRNVDEHGARFTRPGNLVSNGAYQLEEWVVQSHIRLLRNTHYWDNDNTTIDEVYFYPTENQDAELKRFRAGELDITADIPAKQVDWVLENLTDSVRIDPYLGSYYFGFNVTRAPFKDNVKLRTALALAIDRNIITRQVTGAGEIPAYSWVPPVAGYESPQVAWASWSQQERNDEARRLYAEAGYSADQPLSIELLYNTNDNHKRLAIAVAAMWRQELGVQTSLVNQEWKVFLDTRHRKETTEIFRGGWIGDYNDAFTFAQLMVSQNSMNHSGYQSARYDALVGEAAVEGDPAKRAALMADAEAQLLADMPVLPIYFYVSTHLVRSWVGGRVANIMDHHYTKNLYILKH